jgi:hypothetical protein
LKFCDKIGLILKTVKNCKQLIYSWTSKSFFSTKRAVAKISPRKGNACTGSTDLTFFCHSLKSLFEPKFDSNFDRTASDRASMNLLDIRINKGGY